MTTTHHSRTLGETADIAQKLAEKYHHTPVLYCLYGEIGTGKTTFVKEMLRAYGLDPARIKSPTYTYIREYETESGKIYHIDAYRIEKSDELMEHDIEALLQQEKVVIIEWAENIQKKLPDARIDIYLSYLSPTEREIVINEKVN